MIKVYLLPVTSINGTETVTGSDIIHDAILITTEDPNVRKLIMDVTQDEHDQLSALATEHRDATPEEQDYYNSLVSPVVPDPDRVRALELLSTSPDAITQPEMWELMRIFGRLLNIPS